MRGVRTGSLSRRLRRARNVGDVERAARARLPSPIWHYLQGGADDEVTLERNRSAFGEWALQPQALVDVSHIDPSASIFGVELSLPLMLSPTGMSRLFHVDGERAVAGAAAAEGILYGLSTMATTRLEEVAKADGARVFQLYLFQDRGLTESLLERARAAGFHALCLTVDTPVAGNRERDLRTGMAMPPRFGWRSLTSFATHPMWSLGAVRTGRFQLANVVDHVGELPLNGVSVIDYVNGQFERRATWKDVEWLRARWRGPLMIKGLLAAEDCARAASLGCDAVVVSNHGGRQLDGVASPLDQLPAIRDRVQDGLRLVLDGGIRRGTDVLKAIALGADLCSIGRPYLYGLAADGEPGVRRVIALLRAEIERDLALLGKCSIAALDGDDVRRLDGRPMSRAALAPPLRPATPVRVDEHVSTDFPNRSSTKSR